MFYKNKNKNKKTIVFFLFFYYNKQPYKTATVKL